MKSPPRARLRTKTGCLTCRQRRVKCDETLPICQSCKSSRRNCKWPTPDDSIDRRFSSHRLSRYRKNTQDGNTLVVDSKVYHEPDQVEPDKVRDFQRLVLLSSEPAIAHNVMAYDLERTICRHFVDRYYGLIILPGCHPSFSNGWLTEILTLMASHKSLYYSVLACAASHIHLIDKCARMRELGLVYYSSAITRLSQLLVAPSQLENYDGLLTSIILLNIHGCMGWGTYSDIPRHLNAATSIISYRLLKCHTRIYRLFDALAVESVLYHIFHISTGLWSNLTKPDYDFNIDFWIQAETLLGRTTFFPGASRSFNSPVLGIPISLFRLALLLRQQYLNSFPPIIEVESIRSEILELEMTLLGDRKSYWASENLSIQEGYYRDTSSLYSIIISLLWKEIISRKEPGPPLEVPNDSWQVKKAVQILKKYEQDDGWAQCFIGNWPTYTLGFFMSAPEDRQVIRADMQRRWDLTRLAQVSRFSDDLESIWTSRQDVTFATGEI